MSCAQHQREQPNEQHTRAQKPLKHTHRRLSAARSNVKFDVGQVHWQQLVRLEATATKRYNLDEPVLHFRHNGWGDWQRLRTGFLDELEAHQHLAVQWAVVTVLIAPSRESAAEPHATCQQGGQDEPRQQTHAPLWQHGQAA